MITLQGQVLNVNEEAAMVIQLHSLFQNLIT